MASFTPGHLHLDNNPSPCYAQAPSGSGSGAKNKKKVGKQPSPQQVVSAVTHPVKKGGSLPPRCSTSLICSSSVLHPTPRRSIHCSNLPRHSCPPPPRIELPPPSGFLHHCQSARSHLHYRHRQGNPCRVLHSILRLLHQGPQPVLSGRREPLVHPSSCPHSRSTSHSRPPTTLPPPR